MIYLGEKLVSIGMFYRRNPEAPVYTICFSVGIIYILVAIIFH